GPWRGTNAKHGPWLVGAAGSRKSRARCCCPQDAGERSAFAREPRAHRPGVSDTCDGAKPLAEQRGRQSTGLQGSRNDRPAEPTSRLAAPDEAGWPPSRSAVRGLCRLHAEVGGPEASAIEPEASVIEPDAWMTEPDAPVLESARSMWK